MGTNWKMDREYSSLQEYYDYILNTPRAKGSGNEAVISSGDSWDSGMSWEDCTKIMKAGGYWKEGTDQLMEAGFEVGEGTGLGLIDSTELDVAGYAPIVPEYLTGSPTCMLNDLDLGFSKAAKPIVKVGINVGLLGYVDSNHAMARGKAIFSLINHIESLGKSTEIWAVITSEMRYGKIRIRIKVKEAHELWSPSYLAYPITHPTFFRRTFFRFKETFSEMNLDTNYGYGSCVPNVDLSEYDIYFGSLGTGSMGNNVDDSCKYESAETAIEYMQDIAKEAV